MGYSNAQILAAVVAHWSRPAISQIAVSRLMSLPMISAAENTIKGSGLVGPGYTVASEITPFVSGAVTNLVQPALETYFSKIPDQAIPALAHQVLETAMQQPKFSILDGLIEFDTDDLTELKDLLEKNLPVTTGDSYQIIK